ncbi:MAG: hypothetical protein KAG06_05655 [Methylococcales bacterium]|nr:hypothetical protein [Methylococcales bacterium]
MSIFTSIKKKATLIAATKQIKKARKETDKNKADALYKSAYEGFEFILSDNEMLADALYQWGFGLLHQAKLAQDQQAIDLYEEAISKYTFCLIVEPFCLGAALESGVAYMDIARLTAVSAGDDLYKRAKKCFDRAGEIQKGSGEYNLACLHSIKGNQAACLASLRTARDFAHLPDDSDILNDPDMQNTVKTAEFIAFMAEIEQEKAAIEKAEAEKKQAKAEAKLRAGGASNIGNNSVEKTESTPAVNAEMKKTESEADAKPAKDDNKDASS